MFTGADRPEQTTVRSDTTAENGLPSVAHYAKKILLASDNDAFNRLYEFIGQQEFNDSASSKRVYECPDRTHGSNRPLSPENNRYTNPIRFEKDGKVVFEQPGQIYAEGIINRPTPILRGKGYMKDGALVNEPFDFSNKNFFRTGRTAQTAENIVFSGSGTGWPAV